MPYRSATAWRLLSWMLPLWVAGPFGAFIGCSESVSPRSSTSDALAKLTAQALVSMDHVVRPANLSAQKSVETGIDEPGHFYYYTDGNDSAIVVRFPLSAWSLEWTWYWKGQELVLCRDRLISDRQGGAYVPARDTPVDHYLYFEHNRLVYSKDVQDRIPESLLSDRDAVIMGEFFRKFKLNDGNDIDATLAPGWMNGTK